MSPSHSLQALLDEDGQLTDLLRGLIYIAKEEDPHFSEEAFHTQWKVLSKGLRIPQDDSIFTQIARLNLHFFETLKFSGAEEDYYHTDNSLIHKVLQKKSGMPILVASIYLLLGRMYGLPLEGISFPGHFLVGVRDPLFFIDVFHKGTILRETDIKARFNRFPSSSQYSFEQACAPTTAHNIIIRINNNLLQSYKRSSSPRGMLRAIDRNLILAPEHTAPHYMRAFLLRALGKYKEAAESLEIFLCDYPNHPSAEELLRELSLLKGIG